MIKILQATAICLIAFPAFAQDKLELAREYVNLPAMREVMDVMFSQEMQIAQLEATLPPSTQLSEDQFDRIGKILADELSAIRPDIEELMITTSAETFSAAELEALIAFYTSEHGATVMKKMQPFMSAFLAKTSSKTQEMQQRALPKIIKIIQEPKE